MPLTPAPAAAGRAPTATGPTLTRRSGYSYQRRRPETTTLYEVVRDNVESLYAAVEDGFASAPLPKFVRDELEGYLDCGVLCRGAALLVCSTNDCPDIKVISLSCKGRGFCPSCLGRRMAQTAANLVDHVIPQGVPLRQWVLTFPFELRARLGFDAKLLSAVCSVFNDALLSFYERALRARASDDDAPGRRRKLQSGTVTVVQRVSSDFRLNPHLHVVALDGVFAEQPDGPPRFVQLPELDSLAVAELVTTVRIRLVRLLERRGVLDSADEPGLLPSDEADRDPVLAQLTAAAVSGVVPAGPERRQRPALRLLRPTGASVLGPLCASDSGFTLHAATVVRRDDPAGKEALLRYVLRPPLAQDRLTKLDDGLVRLTLKRAFSDGTTAIDLDPLSLLCRLAASVPGPGFNTVRYGGVLSPAARWRPLIVPKLAARDGADTDESPGSEPEPAPSKPPTHRSGWRPWAELLKRTFDIDIRCPRCGNEMKLKSFLTNKKSLDRLLTRLREPTEIQGKAPARSPPYFSSREVRRRFGDGDDQLGLFDGAA